MFTNRPRTSGCRRARSPTSRPDPMTETREIAAAGPGPNRNPTRKIRKSRRFVASIVIPGRTIRNNSAETVLFFRRHTTCPSLSACRRRDNGRKRTGTPTANGGRTAMECKRGENGSINRKAKRFCRQPIDFRSSLAFCSSRGRSIDRIDTERGRA